MAIWLFKIDLLEFSKTLLISITIMALGVLSFIFMWLRNQYFSVPTDSFKVQYNFSGSTSYFKKMQVLIMDLKNHDFWI